MPVDYSKMEQGELDELLEELISETKPRDLIQIPGAYEVLSEHFNNDVLERWAEDNPDLAYLWEVKDAAGVVIFSGPEHKARECFEEWVEKATREVVLIHHDGGEEERFDDIDPYVQVLCGCGWGSLKMRESEVPDECQVCGNPVGTYSTPAESEAEMQGYTCHGHVWYDTGMCPVCYGDGKPYRWRLK